MSYVKQTWATGDTVTSAKLNHMEDGIASGGGMLIVTLAEEVWENCDGLGGEGRIYTFSHTWQEMKDAFDAHTPIFLYYPDPMSGTPMSVTMMSTVTAVYEDSSMFIVEWGGHFIEFDNATDNVKRICHGSVVG